MITLSEKVSRSFRYYYYGFRNNWDFPYNMSHLAGGKIAKGSYEPAVTRLLKKYLQPGSLFIDVGANVGYFSRMAGEIVGKDGKVYAFEVDSNNFMCLCRNIKGSSNILPFHFAISDKNAFLDLNISTHAACHSLVETENNLKGETSTVFSISLDHFWENYLEKQDVDLLKVDVEGAEIFVLSGMQKMISKGAVKNMIIEFCPEILKNAGFEIADFYNKLSSDYTINVVEEEYRNVLENTEISTFEELLKLTEYLLSRSDDAVNINLFCTKRILKKNT